jgi:hypothetical protein
LSEKKKIRFIYNKPDDYEILYVNGVFGGVTPRGDINCHFFFEYPLIPKAQEFEIEEGKLGKELVKATNTSPVNRDLKVGIVFKAEDAESIANWILDKVKLLRGEKIEQT